EVIIEIRGHLPLVGTTAIGSLYTSGPIVIAAYLLTSTGSSSLVSADKLYRLSLVLVVALANALVSWVLEHRELRSQRSKTGLVLHLVVGLLGGILFAAFGPAFSAIFFGSNLATNWTETLAYGF